MSTLQAILMGFIQGLTEFLPVSSSGHLVLVSSVYKLLCGHEFITANGEEVFFDIVLHLGTLFAIFIFFWKDLIKIIKEFVNAVKTKNFSAPEAMLPIYLVVGTIFTILVAYPLKDVSEKLISSPAIVGCFLILTGCVLFFSEIISTKINLIDKMNFKRAIAIGIAQGLAAFPGLSRSGMTISTGLLCGVDRVTSARYSFLLSILIIIGTSIFYPILEIEPNSFINFNWGSIVIGFFVSLIVGYFCIKYFMKFLNKHSMKIFAYYCWIVGTLMAVGFHFFVK
ncbi:MAG: undecaprenyl-diphosphate phosphatase [Candidatus Gastranaerophilales bacterium]|nr:undecaprenyl-diphosphate phosphatase [Candidatus Gastranaerophilales bacterium]